MIKIILVFFVLLPQFIQASDHSVSAYRRPGVSYTYYVNRTLGTLSLEELISTPLGVARLYGTVTLPSATSWSADTVVPRFHQMRDTRFLKWNNRPSFARRSSWLYPDDGCFARATLANKNLFNWNIPVPKKIFVFGNLKVRTKNNPRGYVTWWYHMAPIIEVNNSKYVLDPAIDPNKPLPLHTWLEQMGTPAKLKVAICASGTYAPKSSCSRLTNGRESEYSQQKYLDLEWSRLKRLGRKPEQELGNAPPW